jgi:hypothetical protein
LTKINAAVRCPKLNGRAARRAGWTDGLAEAAPVGKRGWGTHTAALQTIATAVAEAVTTR